MPDPEGSKEKLLTDYYPLTIEEEHYFLSEHQRRISFFSGLISALFGGIFWGILRAKNPFELLILVPGPLMIIIISDIAFKGCERLYQRFLEAITVRAKIEQDLGLAEERGSANAPNRSKWVLYEPYVTERHVKSRYTDEFTTSKKWIEWHLEGKSSGGKQNYHGIARRLFRLTGVLGWVLLSLMVVYAIGMTQKCFLFGFGPI